MLLTSIDPFFQEFERQFDRGFDRLTRQSGAVMPMDGLRREDDVLLHFDVPGIDPDSIEVNVDRGVLTVSAERKDTYDKDDRLFVRERVMGTFTRRVYLSEHLDADAIEAAYSDGVLAVRIPVLERAKPRKVEIKRTSDGHKAIKS